jgi:hypothetical protein
MKNALRLGAWFVVLLIATDQLAALVAAKLASVRVAYMDEARSPQPYESWLGSSGHLETLVLVSVAILFIVSGALLASRVSRPRQGLLLAVALGLSFTALRFLGNPWIVYSHAPLWLWVLSWSPYYVPPVAAAVGAVLWSRLHLAQAERHAA